MKLFDDDSMRKGTAGSYGFSGMRPEHLGATEYTLVTLTSDKSGSLRGFEQDLLTAKRAAVDACKKSPRADFLMLRDVEFNTSIDEVHGFRELAQIDTSLYVPMVTGGLTALYDAVYASVAATNEYAKTLAQNDFGANAIVFALTDSGNNKSVHTPADIAAEIARGVQNEWLESLIVVLVGINAQLYTAELQKFQQEAGITQFVDVGEATPQRLAKLANFVSRSVSAQSQARGTGGPSQPLAF